MRSNKLLLPLLAFLPSLALAGPPPGSPAIGSVFLSSMTLNWTMVASDGYIVELSTASDFSGVIVSSVTTDFNVTSMSIAGLSPNTTYYAQIGALYPGSTSYALTTPTARVTLAPPVSGGTVSFVNDTLITANWAQPSEGVAYQLEADVTPAFSVGTTRHAMIFTMSVTTLTLSGMTPSTLYYVRVANYNWEGIPTYSLIGSTTTSPSAFTAPAGLTGTAQSPTSIQWTWTMVPGATSYTLYQTTSPATVVGVTPSSVWVDNGLQINTPYTRSVFATGGGQMTSASTSTPVYTQAYPPPVPTFSGIGNSSFTATWAATGNPGYTLYEISTALNSGFTIGVSTPVPFSAGLIATSTAVLNLAPSTTYWVRIRAQNGGGLNTVPSPTSSVTTLGSTSTVIGQGTATLDPVSIPEGGQVQSTTITFVVPAGGYTQGGGLKVQLPFGWGPFPQTTTPGGNGYVSALSVPSRTLMVVPSGSDSTVEIALASGQSLVAGSTIQVMVSNMWTPCPSPNQTTAVWSIASRSGGGGAFAPIPVSPSQSLLTGPARYLGFNDWSPLTILSGQASSAMILEGRNNCGHAAPMASSLVVMLNGYLSDNVTQDAQAQFSSTAAFSTTITSVTIGSGSTQATFYYKTSTLGSNLSLRASFNDFQNASPTYISRSVNVLNQAVSFSGLSLDNGTAGSSSQTSYTLSPDNDGTNDFAYIRFVPSDMSTTWHIRISSNGFATNVFERYGMGDPGSTLMWDGKRSANGGAAGNVIVPNGTYQVNIEVPGLTSVTSLTITVTGASITGQVRMGGSGIANAWVNAQSMSGSGYASAQTDNSGNFSLNGLTSGKSYNLSTNFYDPATQTPFNGFLSGITAPATGADFVFSQPAQIRVAAVLGQAAGFTSYGQVMAQTTDYSRSYNGTIRIQTNSTSSDNGDSFSPSGWTVLVVQPGTYNVRLEMAGYSTVTQTVTVTAGSTTDVGPVALVPRATIFGLITLPAPVVNSQWISVEGQKAGQNYPSVWGGTFLNVGQSSGIFQIYNVETGAYVFRVRAPGFVPVSLSTTVTGTIGSSMTGGLDFPSGLFSTGGTITGTLTVNGNSLPLGTTLQLWLNAYSSTLGSGEFAQIYLPSNATQTSAAYTIGGLSDGQYQIFPPYLSGFELNPPGPKTVTVSGGVGTLNLTLQENTGQVSGTILLPGSNSDYSQVTISVNGNAVSTTTVPSGSTYAVSHLGSGFVTVVAYYATTGATVRQSISVINGQTSTLNLNLAAPTYSVSGTASIQSAFTMESSSGATVTINTITDLLAQAVTQNLYLGGQTVPLSTARIEAFPKNFNDFGNSNRSGFGNTFNLSGYKYGLLQADGSYSISGLTPGVWEISVYPFLDGGQTPALAAAKQTLTISNANKTGIDFPLSSGYSLSGTVSLPTGLSDYRTLDVRIVTDRGDYVQSRSLSIGAYGSPANSTTYLFRNLPDGHYVLNVIDQGNYDSVLQQTVRKYVVKPVAFEIEGSHVTGLDLTMARASRIVGKLAIKGKNSDGTPSSTQITANNRTLLPDNLRIAASAVPWVEGGYQEASREFNMSGRISIDANNRFTIDGLVPGTYDVQFRQDSYGAAIQSQGSSNLAGYVKGQVLVTEGQVTDLDTIELQQGLSITGTVSDGSGNALPNILVRAEPSGRGSDKDSSETYTDLNGKFTLTGLSPTLKIYNLKAAPRPYAGDFRPPAAYGQVVQRAIDVTQVPAPTPAFTLSLANASLSGSVVTADAGALSFPDGDQQGYPAAAVYFQRQGAVSADNPLGEIEIATSLDGSLDVTNLVPGIYDITVMSLNYKPKRITKTIAAGSNSLGTVTLEKGSVLTVSLAKPDGSSVSTEEVRFAVAATSDLSSILFGQVTSDDNTRTISSLRFSGFETNKRYSLMLFDPRDNITNPSESRNMTFTTDTEDRTLSVTFKPSAPTAYTQIRRVGTAVEVTFYFSRSLRSSIPADDDVSSLVTLTNGAGTITDAVIAADRRSMALMYTPPTGEETASLRFSGYTSDVDATTGSEFPLTKAVTLRFGQKATAEKNISPVFGGEVSLSEVDTNPSAVSVPANALKNSDGSDLDTSVTYPVTFTATDDLAQASSVGTFSAGTRHSRTVSALSTALSRGAGAYWPEVASAMSTARTSASISPFSAFYSVLLPAGISHALNSAATLTLQYSSGVDPESINVYYYDGQKYLIENSQRVIDTVNRTISVQVSHFSTFVVLENSQSVVTVDGDASAESAIEVFNFPNPFDLTTKTKTLAHGGTSTSLTTDGTIVRYSFPSSVAGPVKLVIYNVVGEKVRTIDLGSPSAATVHYATWDGKNDDGQKVASGVYVGVLNVGGQKKVWKMAVIK